MVDHRADDDQGLNFLGNARETGGWQRPSLLQQARDWVSDRFGRDETAFQRSDTPLSEWLQTNWLPVGLSGIWAGVLIAYGIGYFARLGSVDGGTSMLPTVDLLFFAFAILGPIAMIWFAVAMLNRAAYLSDAIAGQSESALALAATINNLNDSVDALSTGTTGRLEQACDRMEREAAASVKTLETSLADATSKLEAALLDGVILMDRNLKDRSDRVATALESQQSQVAQDLQDGVAGIKAAFQRDAKDFGVQQRDLMARTDKSLGETIQRLQTTLKDLTAQQKAGLGAAHDVIQSTANTLATDLTATLKQQITRIEDDLKSTNTNLVSTATTTSKTVAKDLGSALGNLRNDVDQIRQTIAANPPATSEDLAALMGEAVHRIISPERSALTQSVLRITALEEQARTLLAQIDRTSRLMPFIDSAQATIADVTAPQDDSLFKDLPTAQARKALNMTAVVHVLSGAATVPGTREIVDMTLLDPDIASLVELRDDVLNALGERGLFAEDLKPQHCNARIWLAWLLGHNGFDVTPLAGIREEVSNAIARGWLHQSSANLSQSLEYLKTYQRVLHRAVSDGCEDRHIVELADTSAGRLFILLGGLNNLFRKPLPPETTLH